MRFENALRKDSLTSVLNSFERIASTSLLNDSSQPMNLITRIPEKISFSDLMRESSSLCLHTRNALPFRVK